MAIEHFLLENDDHMVDSTPRKAGFIVVFSHVESSIYTVVDFKMAFIIS